MIKKIASALKKYTLKDYRYFITRRILHTYRQKFHYLSKDLIQADIESLMKGFDLPVQELTYEDFANSTSEVFSPAKLHHCRKRLLDSGYKAYGIFENGRLAYSCWISLEKLDLPSAPSTRLEPDEGLLEDAYCAPEFRGRGYHSLMNNYRLMKLLEAGRKKVVAIVMDGNTPAYKVQMKSGFRKVNEFYISVILGFPIVGLKREKH